MSEGGPAPTEKFWCRLKSAGVSVCMGERRVGAGHERTCAVSTRGWRLHHPLDLLQPQTRGSTLPPTQTLLTFTYEDQIIEGRFSAVPGPHHVSCLVLAKDAIAWEEALGD